LITDIIEKYKLTDRQSEDRLRRRMTRVNDTSSKGDMADWEP